MKSRSLVISSAVLFFAFISMVNLSGCDDSSSNNPQPYQTTGGIIATPVSGTGGSFVDGHSGSTSVVPTGGAGIAGTGGGQPDAKIDTGIPTGGAGTAGAVGAETVNLDSGILADSTIGETGTAGTMADTGGAADADTAETGGSTSVLPIPSDYGAPGPFDDAKMFSNVGPGSNYTMFRPDASLGRDGFKHPIVSWGNGAMTTPNSYEDTLTLFATHGFVIIASNNTFVPGSELSQGLDWLIEQNTAAGELQGKLDTSREATIGYSLGGGAALDAAVRPNVKCTVSFHGMPPREADTFDTMHSPLLLFTSNGDTIVTPSGYVTPNFEKSQVQTFYATLTTGESHLYVMDAGGGAAEERAPAIAWLRLWIYEEEEAKKYFYDPECILCKSPWTYQRKNWP
jgi:hypothetical protein